jgi:hypothetical protein
LIKKENRIVVKIPVSDVELMACFPETEDFEKFLDFRTRLESLGVSLRTTELKTSIIFDHPKDQNFTTIDFGPNVPGVFLGHSKHKGGESWKTLYNTCAEISDRSAYVESEQGLDLQKLIKNRVRWFEAIDKYLKALAAPA